MDWRKFMYLKDLAPKKGRTKCHFFGCHHTQMKNPSIFFFKVPRNKKNLERTHEFLRRMGLAHLVGQDSGMDHLHICQIHFAPTMLEYNKAKITLHASALPCDFRQGLTYEHDDLLPPDEDTVPILQSGQEDWTYVTHDLDTLQVSNSTDHRGGFVNLGRSCFVNAALQHLFSNPFIVEALLKHRACNSDSPCCTCVLRLTLSYLVEDPNANQAPQMIFDFLSAKYKDPDGSDRFKDDVDGDSWDVISAILSEINLDQANSGLPTMESHWEYDIERLATCQVCQQRQINRVSEPEMTVSLKPNLLQSLQDFFGGPMPVERHCYRCKSNTQHKVTSKLVKIQDHLVILVNRVEYDVTLGRALKKNDPIFVPPLIDLAPFSVDKDCKFRFKSAILHHGSSSHSGHYTFIEKMRDKFVTFDDNKVSVQQLPPDRALLPASIVVYERTSYVGRGVKSLDAPRDETKQKRVAQEEPLQTNQTPPPAVANVGQPFPGNGFVDVRPPAKKGKTLDTVSDKTKQNRVAQEEPLQTNQTPPPAVANVRQPFPGNGFVDVRPLAKKGKTLDTVSDKTKQNRVAQEEPLQTNQTPPPAVANVGQPFPGNGFVDVRPPAKKGKTLDTVSDKTKQNRVAQEEPLQTNHSPPPAVANVGQPFPGNGFVDVRPPAKKVKTLDTVSDKTKQNRVAQEEPLQTNHSPPPADENVGQPFLGNRFVDVRPPAKKVKNLDKLKKRSGAQEVFAAPTSKKQRMVDVGSPGVGQDSADGINFTTPEDFRKKTQKAQAEHVLEKRRNRRRARSNICQVLDSMSQDMLTPRKRFLLEKFEKAQRRVRRLERSVSGLKYDLKEAKKVPNMLRCLKSEVTEEFYEFLYCQVMEGPKHPKGRRYSRDLKILCLGIFKSGKRTYRFLGKHFVLPSETTLQRMLRNFPLNVGFNLRICALLMQRTKTMTEYERTCSMIVDETSLKALIRYSSKDDCFIGYEDYGGGQRRNAVANSAFVIMLKGLYTNKRKWKIPLVFYVTSGPVPAKRLKKLLVHWTRLSRLLGFNVLMFGSDALCINRKAYKLLGASKYKPEIFIDGIIIFTCFDPPHQLKCLRNLFIMHIILTFLEAVEAVHFKYVLQAYEIDKVLKPRFCTKLTDLHMSPVGKPKMKVQLAAQLLSYTVGCIMNHLCTYSRIGLPEEAAFTAAWILDVDAWFDSTNGAPSRYLPSKQLRGPLTDQSGHFEFWSYFKAKVETWSVQNHAGRKVWTPTFETIIWTLNSYERMWPHLKEAGFTEFWVSEANSDCIENLFSLYKYFSARHRTPTVEEFINGVRTAFIHKLMFNDTHGGVDSNCEDDGCSMLQDLALLLDQDSSTNMKEYEDELLTAMKEANLADLAGNLILDVYCDDETDEDLGQDEDNFCDDETVSENEEAAMESSDSSLDSVTEEGRPEEENHSSDESGSTLSASPDPSDSGSTSDEEFRDLEETTLQIGVQAKTTNRISSDILQKTNCGTCIKNITPDPDLILPHDFLVGLSEPVENDQYLFSSAEFNAAIVSSVSFLEEELRQICHHYDLRLKLKASVRKKFNFKFGCPEHQKIFPDQIVDSVVDYCLKKYEKNVNLEFKNSRKKVRKGSREKQSENPPVSSSKTAKRRLVNDYMSNYSILKKPRNKVHQE